MEKTLLSYAVALSEISARALALQDVVVDLAERQGISPAETQAKLKHYYERIHERHYLELGDTHPTVAEIVEQSIRRIQSKPGASPDAS